MSILYPLSDFPGYDCFMWAFETLGLNFDFAKYSFADLNKDKFPGLKKILTPSQDVLVAYYNPHTNKTLGNFGYEHFGIVKINFGKVYVHSKWGQGHVYEHPLNHIPFSFGTHADFFEKKD